MPSELKKALLTSAQDALQAEDLDAILHEELMKLQPLAQLMDVQQAESKTHEYNVRTSHPQGWFEGETTPMNQQSGTYSRKTVQLKIQRIWGGVTGFAQAVDEKFIDALSVELEGSLEGMADLMEFGALYGTANDIGFTGDAYQYSGLLPRLFAYAPGNVIDAGGNKITLDDLDAAVAKAAGYRQVRNDPRFWIMGLRMKQVVDGLQAKVSLPLQEAVLDDGKIVMASYAGAPIYESDFVVPAGTSTSPALTSALASGGTLTDGSDFQHQIASVTMYGEQVASALSTARTAGTPNFSVDLSWTADANAKAYMIFRKTDTGDVQLIDIIPAKTYDSAGTVNGSVEAYTDDGSKSDIAIKPLAAGEENIVLVNARPQRGGSYVGMVDDMGRQVGKLLSFVELARVKDSYDYMLKSYLAFKLVYPNVNAVIRHAKLA
jgi:hypothetical protein